MQANEIPRLLLASRSTRRRELLDEHSIAHDVVPSGIDDTGLRSGSVNPRAWVMALAHLKARSGWDRLENRRGSVVIGADTLVVKGTQIIGQPIDEPDARRIVDALNDGTHRVATGVAFIDERGERLIWCDTARVRVGHVDERDRAAYISTGAWRGRAGAYNFAERAAEGWPIECEGDETTVMGLPMKRLPEMIREFTGWPVNVGARA